MSLSRNNARWYLITEHNQTLSRVIVAAETSGSIVGRIRIAWTYEYGTESDRCNGIEGPILSADRSLLFITNSTGILIVADQGHSATLEDLINIPDLCSNNMVFSEVDSMLLVLDKSTYDIIVLNVSTRIAFQISLRDITGVEILAQLSRMTIVPNHRIIILVGTTNGRVALLLLDFIRPSLLASLSIDSLSEISPSDPLTQLTYTNIDDQQSFVTMAHKSVGVATVRLGSFEQQNSSLRVVSLSRPFFRLQ
jgi:hypothetical protein